MNDKITVINNISNENQYDPNYPILDTFLTIVFGLFLLVRVVLPGVVQALTS